VYNHGKIPDTKIHAAKSGLFIRHRTAGLESIGKNPHVKLLVTLGDWKDSLCLNNI
jgi:hypothetical protein